MINSIEICKTKKQYDAVFAVLSDLCKNRHLRVLPQISVFFIEYPKLCDKI